MRRIAALLGLTLLVGCGPGERPYTPQGVSTPAPAKSTAQAKPADKTPSTGPETITIGGKFRMDIEWPADRDPLLELVTDYLVATRKVLVSGNDRYLQDLDLELTAVRQAYDWVHTYTEEEKTVKGATRLYNLRVAAKVGKGVQVNACVDETEARVVSTRTGKAVVPQPDWVRTPYLQAALAHRGDDGVWRIRELRYDLKGCTG
ncbi:hypothetical protein ACTMTI_01530 [Nonomuraea sp. H19]|uniref:hypothetical protein n=1 Tax=Nonomuraea sp. H19 TaxID=3452206 RepID=UPI003F8B3EC0